MIRTAPFLLLGLTLLLAAPAAAAPEDGIDWQHDLAKAREQAKTENKPLVLYFTFDT